MVRFQYWQINSLLIKKLLCTLFESYCTYSLCCTYVCHLLQLLFKNREVQSPARTSPARSESQTNMTWMLKGFQLQIISLPSVGDSTLFPKAELCVSSRTHPKSSTKSKDLETIRQSLLFYEILRAGRAQKDAISFFQDEAKRGTKKQSSWGMPKKILVVRRFPFQQKRW